MLSVLTEKIEANSKDLKFRVNERVRITKYIIIFSKDYTKLLSRDLFIINYVFKTNPLAYNFQDLNGETVIGIFSAKEFLLSKL